MKKSIILCIVLLFIAGLLKLQWSTSDTFAEEDSELSRVIYVMENNLGNRLITHTDTGGEKLVALTFDDGPDPLYTPAVLDILNRYQVKATFFVVGENVAAHPELLKREIIEGHEIENHTYTHPDLSRENEMKTGEEITRTEEIIKKTGNQQPQFFRPPRKLFQKKTIAIAESKGYQMVLWSICVENHQAATPEKMARRVIDHASPGMIILAHDGRLDRSQTIAALPMIIEGFQEKGYQFVTLNELLARQLER